jgi:predicted ATP-binding protein involved in virulence
MRIEKIEIENFRGFKGKHEVSFHPNLNVFVGVNGAGKSSVLDLIGMFIDKFLEDIHNDFPKFRISEFDVNIDSVDTINNIILVDEDKLFKIESLSFNLNYYKIKSQNSTKLNLRSPDYKFVRTFENIKKERINIPIFKHYSQGGQRYKPDSSNDIQDESLTYNQLSVHKDLLGYFDNFKNFSNWFNTQSIAEEQDKIRLRKTNHEDPNLKFVRKAIYCFFKTFNNIDIKNIKTNSNSDDSHYLTVEKQNEIFILGQLSNGERLLLLLVADIASKLAIANPSLDNSLNGKGIVLIDEIETHLHPEWQREVIPALTDTFQNIQFFITTHSPQVLGSVDNQSVIIIENFEFKKAPHTKGRDSNSILTDVLGSTTRDIKYEKAFEQLYDLIDNPDKVEEAKAKLRQMMAELGSDDSEIERAKMHFEFLTEKPV